MFQESDYSDLDDQILHKRQHHTRETFETHYSETNYSWKAYLHGARHSNSTVHYFGAKLSINLQRYKTNSV